MSTSVKQKPLSRTRLVGFDVDGVFTDGRFYLSNDGVESKAFYTQDGFGVRQLINAGIEVAVISGRNSIAVDQRMTELGIRHVIQGCRDKLAAFDSLANSLGIENSDCVFVGDDVDDLPLLKKVGYSVAVANAVVIVRQRCDYTTIAHGGHGAIREICDLILTARPGSDQ